ncbi:MAG: alpha-ketoacid dehydrogenase subunit beta [Holosporales bacterium]|jgi:pyruvate dehydrogenase E1 component beta subunit|nr:alpha-ketoacid dehydrogenase subunit beta [Holosporales bacterium]
MPVIPYSQAIRDGLYEAMKADDSVIVIGQGVPDASQTYGTTSGLIDHFGADRVLEMPISEASMVGIILGASLVSIRPVMVFARMEFAVLAMDQIVNQAAKWHYMFAGGDSVPIVLRMIVGRGWGQGAQHAQSLHNWFAHVPGLKVVMPSTAYDAKGLLISSIEDPNPVIFVEHRWLHYTTSNVPDGLYRIPIGSPNLIRTGKHATVVASSYSTIDAIKASEILLKEGIDIDLIDLRTIAPLNDAMILESVKKTGRLVVCDQGHLTSGFSAEIVARVTEKAFKDLKEAPIRIALPDCPTPTTRALSNYFYPMPEHIVNAVRQQLGLKNQDPFLNVKPKDYLDSPNKEFVGPF